MRSTDAVSQVYGGALISNPLDQVIPPGSIGSVSATTVPDAHDNVIRRRPSS
jgi:hypothetical protein